MIVSIELLSTGSAFLPVKRPSVYSSSLSLKIQALLLKPRGHRLPFEFPKRPGSIVGSLSRNSWNRPIVAFAASHEDSHSEVEVEKESKDAKLDNEESEAWEQTLQSFKEQALKLQIVSQEAYEIYSKKAMVFLQETSRHLKIQAEKAKNDLNELAKEWGQDGVEYLSAVAENTPEPMKEVVETYVSSFDDLNDISKVRDFYLGIPYGLFLSLGGFLSFMLTGSISAVRFGVVLGATLLSLSASSLISYNRGKPYSLALKGQTAIAAIIFLREISILSQRASFFTSLATIISGAMVAFYLYRIMLEGKQSKRSDLEHGAGN